MAVEEAPLELWAFTVLRAKSLASCLSLTGVFVANRRVFRAQNVPYVYLTLAISRGVSDFGRTKYLLNCSLWALTALRAKSLAFRLSLMGVSSRRCSSGMLCSTFSSMGSPWQSHPGTYLRHVCTLSININCEPLSSSSERSKHARALF